MNKDNKLNNEIKKLLKEKRFEEAERILKFIIYFDKSSTALNILGLLSYRKGSYKKSQEYFLESYKIDSNNNARYYLDILFEDNNFFNEYYSALSLCEDKKYTDAETVLNKTTSTRQTDIINFSIKYMKGSIFKRKKILNRMKGIFLDDIRAEKIYKLMCINYKSRVRRLILYFVFIIVLFSGAALILV